MKKKIQSYDNELKVLVHQTNELEKIEETILNNSSSIESAIKESELLLQRLGTSIPKDTDRKSILKEKALSLESIRTWNELLVETEYLDYKNLKIEDLLDDTEIENVLNTIDGLRCNFNTVHKLDKLDWSIVGIAGVLSALTDVFLVKMPAHPGFLGTKGNEGGKLSNYIRNKLQETLSLQEIRALEKENWVPYDAAHSKYLEKEVEGLGPRAHRFQTLGHDPILGFLFGTKDILTKQMTAIDKNGNLIVQKISDVDKNTVGMHLFEAIGRVFGHMKSDVATKAGLPAPLMPLFQFLQVGKFGENNYSIGEVSRMMYRSGYDFSHFLSMSISTLIIEVVVRICYLVKNLMEGKSLKDSLPLNILNNNPPKLQTMLFSSHIISTVTNAGKVYVTGNPLAINYPQWMFFVKYSYKQIKWVTYGKDTHMYSHVQEKINTDWDVIHTRLKKNINNSATESIILKEI